MNKYLAFIKVIELGSMTKAAKEMGFSQPGISNMIKHFEEEVGFPLVQRQNDVFFPTEDGKIVLDYCYQFQLLDENMQAVIGSITGLLGGTIHIGVLNSMATYFLPELIDRFSRSYSNIEMNLREFSVSQMKESLSRNQTDIGFSNFDVPEGFEFHPLFEDEIMLCMSKDHPLTRYEEVPISALNGCDFLMPVKGWDDLVKAVTKKRKFKPNVRHQIASDTAGIAMAAKGLGVHIMSRLQLRFTGDIVVCRPFKEHCYRTMGVCIRPEKYRSPAVQEFFRVALEFGKEFRGNL